MSMKLVKQRWFSETTDETGEDMDSNEIIDMDVEDEDSCSAMQILQKPVDVNTNSKVLNKGTEIRVNSLKFETWNMLSGHMLCEKYHGKTVNPAEQVYNKLCTFSPNGCILGESEKKKIIVLKKTTARDFDSAKSVRRRSRWDIKDRAELEKLSNSPKNQLQIPECRTASEKGESHKALPEIDGRLVDPQNTSGPQISSQANLSNGTFTHEPASSTDNSVPIPQESKKKLAFKWMKRTTANTLFTGKTPAAHVSTTIQDIFETYMSSPRKTPPKIMFIPKKEDDVLDRAQTKKTENSSGSKSDLKNINTQIVVGDYKTRHIKSSNHDNTHQVAADDESYRQCQTQVTESASDSSVPMHKQDLMPDSSHGQEDEQISTSIRHSPSINQRIDEETSNDRCMQKFDDSLSLHSVQADSASPNVICPSTEEQVIDDDEAFKLHRSKNNEYSNVFVGTQNTALSLAQEQRHLQISAAEDQTADSGEISQVQEFDESFVHTNEQGMQELKPGQISAPLPPSLIQHQAADNDGAVKTIRTRTLDDLRTIVDRKNLALDRTQEQEAGLIEAMTKSPIQGQLKGDGNFVKLTRMHEPDDSCISLEKRNVVFSRAQEQEPEQTCVSISQPPVENVDNETDKTSSMQNFGVIAESINKILDSLQEQENEEARAYMSYLPTKKVITPDVSTVASLAPDSGKTHQMSYVIKNSELFQAQLVGLTSYPCILAHNQNVVSDLFQKHEAFNYERPSDKMQMPQQSPHAREDIPGDITTVSMPGNASRFDLPKASCTTSFSECAILGNEQAMSTVHSVLPHARSFDIARAGEKFIHEISASPDQQCTLQHQFQRDSEVANESEDKKTKDAEEVVSSTSMDLPASTISFIDPASKLQSSFPRPLSSNRLQLLEPNLEEEDMELESSEDEEVDVEKNFEEKAVTKSVNFPARSAASLVKSYENWAPSHHEVSNEEPVIKEKSDIIAQFGGFCFRDDRNTQFLERISPPVISSAFIPSETPIYKSSSDEPLSKIHSESPSGPSQELDLGMPLTSTSFQNIVESTTSAEDEELISVGDASASVRVVESEGPEATPKRACDEEKLVQDEPTPYEHLDDNIILCDDSLIKEAKVVRCFCEPTPVEIAENRGCSIGCINRDLYTECGSRCPSGPGCSNRRFHNREYAKVEVFNAGIKGWGLRAAEPLEPGRFIIEYVGEVIDAEEMLRRGRRYGRDPKHVHHYLMALKNGAVIDATVRGNVSRFINHSCDPNCESQKWAVDRHLRVGFFAIKPIAVGEEIVFDYQLERYGRKAQRCFCGAANCRGRIGEDSDNEKDEKSEENGSILDESEPEDENVIEQLPTKSSKKERAAKSARRKKQTAVQRHNKAIATRLSRGPPRTQTQVRELVRLMVQVEQAPQRLSLIQCIRFAHPEVLKLFIKECGLRLLYVFLATDYPIDDDEAVLQLQIKSLELLDVMPIVTRNQVNESHLAFTVEKLSSKKGPIEKIVEDIVRKLVDLLEAGSSSTSYIPEESADEECLQITNLHCEMVRKATKLVEKWKKLPQEFRIPRRERSDTPLSVGDGTRSVRQSEEGERRASCEKRNLSAWRLSGFGPPPKRRHYERRFAKDRTQAPIMVTDLTHLKDDEPVASPIIVTDLTHLNDDGSFDSERPRKRRSRFDIVGERNPSSMYEYYPEDGYDPYAPPPPRLLPESMFTTGLPSQPGQYSCESLPEYLDWNAVYANYDPSSAAYQQFINSYQHYQNVPPPSCSQLHQTPVSFNDLLEAPSPPAQPKVDETKKNILVIEPIDLDNVTDEIIEKLEGHLATLKAKRAEQKKRELETVEEPPPPPPIQPKNSLWVQATTEEGTVYYYNKETRESVWTLPDESSGGCASADTTTDRSDTRATFKAAIVKYVGGMLEPIRKLKFASNDDYKYVLRKLTHTILEKELKRVGETELRATESVKEKARRYVTEYITRLGDGQYSRKNKSHNAY